MSKRTWTWLGVGCVMASLWACSSDEGDDDTNQADSGASSGFDGAIPSGGGGGNARCVFPADQFQCTDWRDSKSPSWFVQEGVCSSAQGTFTQGQTCDATALGGCQTTMGDGSKQTNWFYQGTKYPDAATVQAKCSDDDQVFVTP